MSELYRPFASVLVANRGEIAVRIIRAVREAGLRSIAVASEVDRTAPHALLADTTAVIGPGPARESYLDIDRVLAAARDTGAEAIHPGYGFLAESAEFARRVQEQGLVWIGPPPDVIDALGDKVRAKETASAAGVAVLGGYTGEFSDPHAVRDAAKRLGFPLLVKAAAGGGGRGMRVVRTATDLAGAIASATREAESAFGSGRVFLEPYVDPVRHVEVQVVGDAFGNVVHLGERECSVQRRHQKIVEESPSPVVDAELRATMGTAAEDLVRAAGYVGAGTVEFLLGPDGNFWFLEVNTRLQVEHPITEMVTGLDLVDLQLRVAAGQPVGLDPPAPRGHAIEVRVCAEDPGNRFAPQVGEILYLHLPAHPGVRIDAGVRTGSVVSEHYDSLLLKLIAYGADREEARRRALHALDAMIVLGPRTNVAYLRAILCHDSFVRGDLSTSFLADHFDGWAPSDDVPDRVLAAAAIGEHLTRSGGTLGSSAGAAVVPTPWTTIGPWRAVGGGDAS